MLTKIDELYSEAKQAIESAQASSSLYEVKVKYLGKQGSFSSVLKELGKLSPEERKTIGKKANEVRDQLDGLLAEKEKTLKTRELNQKLQEERIDVTLPGMTQTLGAQHPVWKVMQEM